METVTTSPADMADAKAGDHKCMRHSYPRGTKAGDGRTCRNCGYVDGNLPTAAATPSTQSQVDHESAPSLPAVVGPSTSLQLPEHSPLGASSAERWMHCPGSVALTHAVKTGVGFIEDDPDYRSDGVQAHALAAYCLEQGIEAWEAPVEAFPALLQDMLDAVQIYLDFCNSLQGRYRYVETRVHRPEFHELFYGTLDFASLMVAKDEADFVDYKHGEGVYVEVQGNVQLRYYVFGFIAENVDEYPDDMVIRLHVCQPRYPHPDGEPVHTEVTTAGAIRQWAHEVLLPAMEQTINDRYLSVGEWCRFCPAKLVCPAMSSLADELTYKRKRPLQALDPDVLGGWYEKAQLIRPFLKAIEEETERRVLAGVHVEGVKAVAKRSFRVFKDGAPLEEKYGKDAWQPAAFKSPAQVEKMPDGKAFVAEWAFAPDNGLTVALVGDKRTGIEVKSGADTFGAAVAALENTA